MRLSKILFILTVGIFLSLGLMLFDSFGKLFWLRGGIETLSGPELKTVFLLSRKYNLLRNVIWNAIGTNQESENILNKLVKMEDISLEIVKLRQENEDLRKVLGVGKISGIKFDPAKILAFSNQSLIVVKNRAIPGQPVVSSESSLVGLAGDSGRWNSSVKLLSDPSVKVSVKVIFSDQSAAFGETVGEFGGRVALEKILTSVDLEVGQAVFTSGTDGLPPDLFVGWVDDGVKKTESAVFQKAYIKSAIDPANLNTVFFIFDE